MLSYIHNSGIRALGANLLDNCVRLKVLHAQRNTLKVLPKGFLDSLVALEELVLDLNDISVIYRGTFAKNTALKTLNMRGNPSSCAVGAGGKIECSCADGFSGDGSYCERA